MGKGRETCSRMGGGADIASVLHGGGRRYEPNPTKSIFARSSDGAKGGNMIRLVIDIQDDGDMLATKESVAMLLEPIGKVRIVKVIVDGKEEKR